VLAIKQLYATHYFQTSVDLSFCIQSSGTSASSGFYLITIKASRGRQALPDSRVACYAKSLLAKLGRRWREH
jgi:hypothetical protein